MVDQKQIRYEFERGNLLKAEELALQSKNKTAIVKRVLKQMKKLRRWNAEGRPSAIAPVPRWKDFPKYQKAFEIIKKHKRMGRILDVGCFQGFFLLNMDRKGYICSGCDIQKDLMENLVELLDKHQTKIDFRYCNAEEVDKEWPGGHFDFITMFDSLEHVFDDKKAIKAALKVLAPSGLLIIHVPTGGYPDGSYEHLRMYNEKKLLKLLPESDILDCKDELGRKTLMAVYQKEA